MYILAINGGSSSIKFALFEANASLQQSPVLRVESSCSSNKAEAVDSLLEWVEKSIGLNRLSAIGHRIVHGGVKYTSAQTITEEILEEIRQLIPLDPEHLSLEIELIEALSSRLPKIPQVACFDTAFHRDMPKVAKLLPIPRRFYELGVMRYGFHGISYSFLMSQLDRIGGKEVAQGKVILAHLGNGASLAAVQHGKSIDTSMGFTPTSGVMMGTRSGDLDPGLVRYLSSREGIDAAQFHEMVTFQSGLLGVSETSSDVRDLLECEKQDSRAADAIDLFCYQVKKTIGGYAAALGGVETLVFSGGIGENAPQIRSRICEGLGFLGLQIEQEKNRENQEVISKEISPATIRVIHTNEEQMIANAVFSILNA